MFCKLAAVVAIGVSVAAWRVAISDDSPAATTAAEFPPELVAFTPSPSNPVFSGAGPGHWDQKIRERGWILHESDGYHLWYTGYDGTKTGIRRLGYATSHDGIEWRRHAGNPLIADHWVEDMMVVKHDGLYYMFAEGRDDQAQWLTSRDRVQWERRGTLDIRYKTGKPLTPGPFGTPTAWFENGTWHLFYERQDAAVWLATSRDLKVFTHVQDEPVLNPGPGEYDRSMIALNQIIRRNGRYYAYYHGLDLTREPKLWTTAMASSSDLIHWTKYPGNPLLRENKSSGIVVEDGPGYRLYSMHDSVQLHLPTGK